MFDKLQQLKQLKDLQSEIKQERFNVEKQGTKIVMNGTLEIEEIQLNPELNQEQQEKAIQDALNELIKKVQMSMAQRFRGMM